ncbi:hypothetical protein V500_01658 [Pseudogymnoascus sp. VKM F-4518 (FW-2643)]|nr:hypothetical protein V500_01658 [Pseudogymnoascus sp. VKM F-4518 (FW-2643)]
MAINGLNVKILQFYETGFGLYSTGKGFRNNLASSDNGKGSDLMVTTRGTFPVPEVEDVAADIKTWEEGNQRDLRKLAALISKIIGVVKGCGGNAIVKYDILGDKLAVLESLVPEDVLRAKIEARNLTFYNAAHDAAIMQLGQIIADERSGILQTINHYFADTLAKTREERVLKRRCLRAVIQDRASIKSSWDQGARHSGVLTIWTVLQYTRQQQYPRQKPKRSCN